MIQCLPSNKRHGRSRNWSKIAFQCILRDFNIAMLANIISTTIVIIFLALTAAACKPYQLPLFGARRIPEKPNVILIMTDDQPPDTLAFMESVNDDLIEGGILFENAFITTPLCSPSRASILTGDYAHHHGVKINRPPEGGAPAFEDTSTIATWLDDAGYRTSFMGKYLNVYDGLRPYGYIPPGWDDWQVFIEGSGPKRYFYDYTLNENGTLVQYGRGEENYSTDVLAAKAVDFIKGSGKEPFFLVLSFYAPHQPRTFAERHRDMFRTDEQISPRRPPNFNEEDMSDKPAWIRDLEPAYSQRQYSVYQQAMRSLMAVDDAVGDIVEALERTSQRDNTMIVYLSDNGVTWGEHRLVNSKNCPYEECIRVPFIISYPGMVKETGAKDQLVLNIDVAPTIAEVAGVAPPQPLDGASLKPLLERSAGEWREDFLIEHWPTAEGFAARIPEFKGLKTPEWKYVEYGTGEVELYDLVADPYELENLAHLEKYGSILKSLRSRIQEILAE
jgi:N-acetylglucosamine-6-sulfatase